MNDQLGNNESIQSFTIDKWFESAAFGYLYDKTFGHSPSHVVPNYLREDNRMRKLYLSVLAIFVSAERLALCVVSGLTSLAGDDWSRVFLASQTLDKARHYEIYSQRMRDMGMTDEEREQLIDIVSNDHEENVRHLLLSTIERKDLYLGILGLTLIYEGMIFPILRFQYGFWNTADPGICEITGGILQDELRHVLFAENYLKSIIQRNPSEKERLIASVSPLEKGMEGSIQLFLNRFMPEYYAVFQEYREILGDLVSMHTREISGFNTEVRMTSILRDSKNELHERLNRIGLREETEQYE